MKTSDLVLIPPRGFLGAFLLIWGFQNSILPIAIPVTLAVEGSHFISWRWDFKEKGYTRAWVLSLIALVTTISSHLMNYTGPLSLLGFMSWLPIIFLPLILVQQYGTQKQIPTTVFSMVARHQKKLHAKLGREYETPSLHLGFIYGTLIIISIGYAISIPNEQARFGIYPLVFANVLFFLAIPKAQRRLIPFTIASIFTAVIALAGAYGLFTLYHYLREDYFQKEFNDDPLERVTAIGQLGKLKLKDEIRWRLYVEPGQEPPSHLPILSYNRYLSGTWRVRDPQEKVISRIFDDLLVSTQDENEGEFAFAPDDFSYAEKNGTPGSIRIRGKVFNGDREPLPSPNFPIHFTNAKEIQMIEKSSFGTLIAAEAKSVVDYRVWSGTQDSPNWREEPPSQRVWTLENGIKYFDITEAALANGNRETKTIRQLANKWNLTELSELEAIAELKRIFSEEFQYSTHLTIPKKDRSYTAIENFLVNHKQGHCEYFATSTALLLRACNIPTRYVTGYVVNEKGRNNEYVMRGTHAHAWVRAYIGGRKTVKEESIRANINGKEQEVTIKRDVWVDGHWIDVDLTPSSWLAMDVSEPTFGQKFNDFLLRLREDFQVWRAEPSNQRKFLITVSIIATLLVVYIIWRLKNSRLKKKNEVQHDFKFSKKLSPLNDYEEELEEILGKRPTHLTFSEWLEEHNFDFMDLHERVRFREDELCEEEINTIKEKIVQFLERRKNELLTG